MNFLTSKKAQGGNYLIAIVFLFIFGFTNILFFGIFFEITQELAAAGLYTGEAQITGDRFLAGLQAFDWGIVLLMVGLTIVIGVLSFRISTSPVFFITTVIMGIFWGVVAYFFNFIFIEMVSAQQLVVAQTFFPRTLIICTNLHWIVLTMIIVGSLTLYAKKEKGQFVQ